MKQHIGMFIVILIFLYKKRNTSPILTKKKKLSNHLPFKRAGIAAGADGLLVEMHPTPSEAWCDADQAITPTELKELMKEL